MEACMKKRIQKIILTGFSCLSLTACGDPNRGPSDLNMVISASSNGHYAIATNTNQQAILWNLQKHSYKIIWKDANIYSAYFIKNTDDLMFQDDKTNDVYIEDVNGNIIKKFNPGIATFGELATSDLKNYFASDRWFQLHKTNLTTDQTKQFYYYYCGPNYKDGVIPPAGMPYACDEFIGTGQLFNLSLAPDNSKLIGAEGGALQIWDTQSLKRLKQVIANDEQTVATINPDGSYVVTGDIEELGYMQSLHNLKQPGYKIQWSNPPDTTTQAYFSNNPGNSQQILAMKFIDAQHVLVFYGAFPHLFNFATLHAPLSKTKIDPSWNGLVLNPIKYLPLIPNAATDTNYQKDWPLTSDDFSRDQAIDTSPSAHILVMSMAEKNGIIVYQYDPSTQTLTHVWTGEVRS
jgi:WD40 repeat protein